MSCIGIDVGYDTAVVAIARRGGIDVLANEVSKRTTACMVGFTDKERKHGEAALSGITSNIKNTVTGLKAVIGKKYHSEEIQNEITKVAYNMTESLGNVTIPVSLKGEENVMTPEKCMSMMLKTMAKIAEADQSAPVHDCVLSVSAPAAPPRTAPPRTAPHRTAPHRTAPHRTAPHRTAPHHTAPHRTVSLWPSH
jgi:heat shock protein 4